MLPGVVQNPRQLLGVLRIARREERVCDAPRRRAAGAANAMNVVIGAAIARRVVVVDDAVDAGDVQTTCGHVGRDEHLDLPRGVRE